MAVTRYDVEIGGRTMTLETGRLAGLAGGSVLVTYGETVVLAAVTSSSEPREGIDFFPLQVEFEEKMYAAGKIPGGFIKREGRPTEQAILTARLTDRPLRPLFPKDYRNDVQVIVTVLSADQVNDPSLCSIVGASAALMISDIPFYGPVGAVRLGYIDGEIVVNPPMADMSRSDLDLMLAATADAVLMVEAGANELPEETVLEAIEVGHAAMAPVIALQNRMRAEVGKVKREIPSTPLPEGLYEEVAGWLGTRMEDTLYDPDKATREDSTRELRKETFEYFADKHDPKLVGKVFAQIEKETVRRNILDRGRRPDGRDLTAIRPVSCEVGVLPRPHGSALFTRGQTQVLSVLTLGTEADEQRVDSIGLDEPKRYIHHYNFPPFSVGEARPMRGPGRRDIGHGALAERGLIAVLPSREQFPYAIRIVSEVLSSNGSSSMASTCGSTLALMHAGVPIKAPVAGVAMGLITSGTEDGRYAVLTDIQGVEDALGDMDFKVAGTEKGITALQMDIKVRGITSEIMRTAMSQAREGRMFIMGKMLETISTPRTELSPFAPRVTTIKINPDRIRDVIGPGGKVIRKIVDETKCTIDINDDGTVQIGSTSEEHAKKAIDWIERLTKDVEPGAIYTGKVTRIMAFGAFVEIAPGKEGLVHISELADYRVPRVEDVVNIGDEVKVVVTEIDRQGRINLSRRALLEPSERTEGEGDEGPGEEGADGEERPRRERAFGDRPPRREGGFGDRPPRREGGFGDRPPRREGGYGDRDRGDRPPRREGGYGDRDRGERTDGPPRREGGYGDRDRGDRPPRREGGYGDRPPRREGGTEDRGEGAPPRREGGYGDRDRGDRPPRREGGYADRGERPPRREGGFADRDRGERPPRREGGPEDRGERAPRDPFGPRW